MRVLPLSRRVSFALMLAAGVVSAPSVYADDDITEDAQERTAVAESKLTLAQALETAGKSFLARGFSRPRSIPKTVYQVMWSRSKRTVSSDSFSI